MVVKQLFGEIVAIERGQVVARCPNLAIGSLCWLHASSGHAAKGLVSSGAFCRVTIAPIDTVADLKVGDQITSFGRPPTVSVGDFLLGQVVDPWGMPLTNGKGPSREEIGWPMDINIVTSDQKGNSQQSDGKFQTQNNPKKDGSLNNWIGKARIPLFEISSTKSDPTQKSALEKLSNRLDADLAAVLDNGASSSLAKPSLGSEGKSNKGLRLQGYICQNTTASEVSIYGKGPAPLERELVRLPLSTGIKAIDGFCTLAKGQRIGIFAPAGVGKTSLLQMIINGSDADVIVVGLVGERGREVREFVSYLAEVNKLKRTIIVASLSDDPPALRTMAANSATAIAEYFRNKDLNVLLLVDSLTRVARALREVAIPAGEIPLRGGFPPSVYSELPILIERAGATRRGSITGVYTVLLPGKDETDFLAEEIKSLVDAHIFLSEDVRRDGIRPAIDILASVSRIFEKINSADHLNLVSEALKYLDLIRKNQLFLMLGVEIDQKIRIAQVYEQKIKRFLNQNFNESVDLESSQRLFRELMQS